MNRKVQKVIEKLIKYGNSELSRFEDFFLEGKWEMNILAKAIILLYFKQVDLNGNKEKDKFGVNILFLDSAKIFDALYEIYTNIGEKVAFLEWYMERFVAFYKENSFQDYENMGCLLLEECNTYLNVPTSKKRAMFEKERNSEIKEQSYYFYKESCVTMQKLKEKNILYTQQYDSFAQLGMKEEFIREIRNYQLFYLLNNAKVSTKKKKERLSAPTLKDKKKSVGEPNIPHSNQIEEDKSVVFENSISHRNLKDELEQYINHSTLENKRIIEGDTLSKVDSLLRQLYPEAKVFIIEKRIQANNEKMKREMYAKAMQEIMPNEQDIQLFLKAKDSLSCELKFDSFYGGYLQVVRRIVCEVEAYIIEYISLSEEEKMDLCLYYVSIVIELLEELRIHIDFLPFSEDGPLLN